MKSPAPGRAQLERDVADVVGENHAHQGRVWQAIGMLTELCDIEESSSFVYLCERAATHELSPAELATKMTLWQELP